METKSGGPSRSVKWLAYAACGWALLYAAYRLYYALGGTVGMFGTPVSMSQWRLINAVGAAIIFILAVLPVATLPLGQHRRARTADSQKPGVRTANSARRHPRLRRARAGCSQSDLLATQRGPRRLRRAECALSLRELLHRSPKEFGRQSTLWTLKDAAEVSFEEGLTNELVSGETIRATLSRLGAGPKRWIESPDPQYARKKMA